MWPVLLLVFPLRGLSGAAQPDVAQPGYHHAYYLFIDGPPQGCEACYVPLLVTSDPLEHIAQGSADEQCVLIITYERDSIWHDDGVVPIAPRDIQKAPRKIRVRDREYRYQEISSSEVLKLLENPMGSIPISRPLLPSAAHPSPAISDLIRAFRQQR
jgi:hypothetical protein